MIVAGLDENGLGPGLGPLVVTAVAVEVPGDAPSACRLDRFALPSWIADSKTVFRRTVSSYGRGEGIALALLAAAGRRAPTLDATVADLTRGACLGTRAGADLHVLPLPLPLWGGAPDDGAVALEAAGVRVRDVACRVLLPEGFNRMRAELGSKSTVDYRLFEDALADLEPPVAAVLADKIGGRKAYAELLGARRRFADVETVFEEPAESRYRARLAGHEVDVRFVAKGDATYLPIALASLVGKYVREASMLVLNRALGFDGALPHASGYWSDPKTREAIARFDAKLGGRVPRDAFLRDG